jgi:uncharacterized protein YuzE
MTFDMDTVADTVYVHVSDAEVASTRELDPQCIIDYDAHGGIIGIEFLGVRRGVDLSGLPYEDELATYFGERS